MFETVDKKKEKNSRNHINEYLNLIEGTLRKETDSKEL
jgi:hypothetical protein